ncbi:MAG TPA: Phenylacetic acid catabolic protein [Parvularculaceae bacterium]|nr:Phenylacetic acid catabolic protein [Parvularculaceae bacterium]
MADDIDIAEYLARGGKLTAPDNAPPRYRAELMRQMASFVDSELAGAAGFADGVNWGPSVAARIAASRIVMEKLDHAERVLALMGEFGANVDRYESVHPWSARIDRDEDLGSKRFGGDMRLNVFHYPLTSWTDAVAMNVLMGAATIIQLEELSHSSYQPFGDVLSEILPRERRHAELGEEGLAQIAKGGADARKEIEASLAYWRPRVAATFGAPASKRFDLLKKLGLRHRPNDDLHEAWTRIVEARLADLLPN